jgi:hypothetical protein
MSWAGLNDLNRGAGQSRFLLGGSSMSKEQNLVFTDHVDRDLYIGSQARDRALNAAIVQADISQSFKEFLEIFDLP